MYLWNEGDVQDIVNRISVMEKGLDHLKALSTTLLYGMLTIAIHLQPHRTDSRKLGLTPGLTIFSSCSPLRTQLR